MESIIKDTFFISIYIIHINLLHYHGDEQIFFSDE